VSDARRLLERLLRKGERARLRGDATAASLPMTTPASARDYLSLRTLAERETFHAQVALAERAGAIAVQRDRHRGDGDRLLRLTVADLDTLAGHLGVLLLDAPVREAAGAALARAELPGVYVPEAAALGAMGRARRLGRHRRRTALASAVPGTGSPARRTAPRLPRTMTPLPRVRALACPHDSRHRAPFQTQAYPPPA
jgi:hypothetical protein